MSKKPAKKPKPEVVPQKYALVPVAELQPHPRNPRKGAIEAIDQSIAENGFYGAVVAQKSTSLILAGRHRWERAQAAGIATVPVIWVDVDDQAALRILTADNRTSDLAGYDAQALAELLDSVKTETGGLEGTGYDQAAFDEILAQAGDAILAAQEPVEETEPPQVDRAEELLGKWHVERGQIWEIGKHRLMCGDSTSEADVQALMKGERAALMATDPPYGVGYGVESGPESAKRFTAIQGDKADGPELQKFLEQVFTTAIPHLNVNAAWYLWHAQLTQGFFAAAAAAAAQLLVHRQIIWAKSHFILGHGDYHWKHELCFYGWRQGNRPPWLGDRSQHTVWEIENPRAADGHPTSKPPEIFARPMRNHLKPGELCYEPFSGSGSQFVAAEQCGVRCYGMEIEPKYCSVILERMQKLGLEPKLAA